MPPLLAAAIGSLMRAGLMVLAGYLVQKGLWTQDAANEYVTAAALALLGVGWSLWQKYKSHLTFLMALSLPAGSTPADVKSAQDDAGAGKAAPLVLLVLLLPMVTGCAPKAVTFDTPTTQVMYYANDTMTDLGKVRTFAWDLYQQQIVVAHDVRVTVTLIDVADAALSKAGGGWRDVASTGAWTGAAKLIPELGEMPATWQGAVRQAWAVLKTKVPILTTNAGWAVLAGAVDGALAKLGG